MVKAIAALIIGYLLGSVSFGIILPRIIAGTEDIRKLGSGNAGTTNVLRTQGKSMALLVLLGDVGKGLLGCWLGLVLAGPLGGALGSLGTLLGHCYPLYFQFKGGKGVATGVATVIMIEPRAAILALAIFAIIVLWKKIVSLGSILGAASIYVTIWLFKPELPLLLYCLFAPTFVIIRHRSNIKRIVNGTEAKINLFSERSSS